MKKKIDLKGYFSYLALTLFCGFSSQSAFSESDLVIEHDGSSGELQIIGNDDKAETTPEDGDPTKPKKFKTAVAKAPRVKKVLPVEIFNPSFGLGFYNDQKNNVPSTALGTSVGGYYNLEQDGYGNPTLRVNADLMMGAQKEQSQKQMNSFSNLKAGAFVGYSFNNNKNGVDAIIGAGGSTEFDLFNNSKVEGNLGAELGLHIKTSNTSMMFNTVFGVGGESCDVTMEDGKSYNFSTHGAFMMGGVGRLTLGKNVYVNVFYLTNPSATNIDKKSLSNNDFYNKDVDLTPSYPSSYDKLYERTKLSSETADFTRMGATIYIKLGKKMTLSGNCTISEMNNTDIVNYENEKTNAKSTKTYTKTLKDQQFNISIRRNFGN